MHGKNYGFWTHIATIQSDIAALIAADYEIETIRSKQNKYYLSNREFELPELKLLIDAAVSSKMITEKKSRQLTEKLMSLASIHDVGMLKRNIIIADRIKARNEQIYDESEEGQKAFAEWKAQKEREEKSNEQ